MISPATAAATVPELNQFGPVPVHELKEMVAKGLTVSEKVILKSRGRATPGLDMMSQECSDKGS